MRERADDYLNWLNIEIITIQCYVFGRSRYAALSYLVYLMLLTY